MDIQNFSVTAEAAATVNVPMFTITAQIYDDDQNLVADFTGQDAIVIAGLSSTLSADQRQQLVSQIAQTLVLMRAGLI